MRKSLMRMTLRQLQIFNEVCDLRSYSRAAEEMSLTQPAVSLQIRQLEELIGQPLFDYVGKKLYMTEAAEALQRASRDIFGRLENLDMQLSDMQGSLQGQLKLAVESSAKYFVPHLFAVWGITTVNLFELFAAILLGGLRAVTARSGGGDGAGQFYRRLCAAARNAAAHRGASCRASHPRARRRRRSARGYGTRATSRDATW